MKLNLYTDGSYVPTMSDVTFGGIVLLDGDKPLMARRIVSRQRILVNMNNVGGELQACVCGMYVAAGLIVGTADPKDVEGEIDIYHDYKGISELIVGRPIWRPRRDGTKYYVLAVQGFKEKYPKIKLKYVKVKAHTGNKWNDVADTIANGIVPYECKEVMWDELVQN